MTPQSRERARVLHYRGATGNLAAEVVFLDNDDKVTRYFAHYG